MGKEREPGPDRNEILVVPAPRGRTALSSRRRSSLRLTARALFTSPPLTSPSRTSVSRACSRRRSASVSSSPRQNGDEPAVTTRAYELAFPLKYGCNPHQVTGAPGSRAVAIVRGGSLSPAADVSPCCGCN